MFTITKEFRFSAAHSLPHLPLGHKCRNLHGHNYSITVGVYGDIDDGGFVVDYAEISSSIDPIIKRLDHQNLNDVLPCKTTAENIAKWIFDESSKQINCAFVTVKETDSTSATYRPNQQ